MQIFKRDPDPMENIEWRGQPIQGIQFARHDFFLIPFSIVACGFAIFWGKAVITGNSPLMFKLFVIPFVLIGLYFVAGRFICDSYKRSKMYYAITNKRILIKNGNKIESVYRGKWPTIKLTEYSDGTGTVAFSDSVNRIFYNTNLIIWNTTPSDPCFIKINDAKKVYQNLC